MSYLISYSPLPENRDEGVSQAPNPKKFITILFYSSYLMVKYFYTAIKNMFYNINYYWYN
jgi:hypothetical protein